jgi:putative serine protease PepD
MSRFSSWFPVVAGAIAGAIVAVVVSSGGGATTKTVVETVSASNSGSSIPTAFTKSGGLTVNQIYRKDSPGVVDIDVTQESSASSSGLGGFFGNSGSSGRSETEAEGAGVVYDTKGDILTDEHVVANATHVVVHFQDGYSATARVLDSDASTDVGVIRVHVPSAQLHPIPFANSDEAQVGDPVVAIGSPFSLPETTTAGIVSATGRSILAPNNFTILGAIQTDAAINPGNSGGPLLDAQGEVLGLNDQIQTNSGSSSGVGFATPGNTDVQIANAIIAGHPIKHAYVGVCLQQTNTGQAQIATSPGENCSEPVAPNSPASQAGLEPGDVILDINGKAISSTDDFINTVGKMAPGQKLTLTIKRDGSIKKIPLTLGTRPASAPTG